MSGWVVYLLSDPRDPDHIRYVGVTHQRLRTRVSAHLVRARKGGSDHRSCWLRKLLGEGVYPVIRLYDFGEGASWGDTETVCIQLHRSLGHDLTNATSGGEGAPGHVVSPEARDRLRKARLGTTLSAEHRAKISAWNRGKKMSPEAVAKSVAGRKGAHHSHETREKIAAAKRGKPGAKPSAEVVAKRAAAIRLALAAKRASGWSNHTSEIRAKRSAALKGKTRDEDTRKRMAVSHTPEVEARRIAAYRATRAKQKADRETLDDNG